MIQYHDNLRILRMLELLMIGETSTLFCIAAAQMKNDKTTS